MITSTAKITRMALAAFIALCLGSTVMAGPGPMYMMIHGKMMVVTPVTKDVTFKNGCKICADGTMTAGKAKPTKLKEGEMISSQGVLMKPAANKAHGGG